MREKIYTQNLTKRISFICKECNSSMKFMRKTNRIIIECPVCKIYFVFAGSVHTKYTNIVYWGKSK
jgi:hypothetical protein